jgi:hypothetical protein
MRSILKIVLILVGFIVFALLFGLTKSFSGGMAGFIGVLLMVGFFAGARAIWNYNPTREDESKGNELDKN